MREPLHANVFQSQFLLQQADLAVGGLEIGAKTAYRASFLCGLRAGRSQRQLRQRNDMKNARLHMLGPVRWQRNPGCFLGHDDLPVSFVGCAAKLTLSL